MKRRILVGLVVLIALTQTAFGYESFAQTVISNVDLPIEAGAVVVMEAGSGRVLYEKNAGEKRAMASTTKILTTLIALEQADTQEEFTVSERDILVEGSSMGLRAGDRVTLDLLSYGMILPSGNDAANVTAVHIAGNKENFAVLMNQRAKEIGMLDSSFVTPSGLDAPEHYSTAYDMALLTREAMQNPRFREICSQSYAHVMLGNPPTERTLKNYNKLLEQYEYCIGVKTGYTEDAGRCLVSAACKDGMELIVVTMRCSNDFAVHKELYAHFFDTMKLSDLSAQMGDLEIPIAGHNRKMQAIPCKIPLIPMSDREREELEVFVELKEMLYAPIPWGKHVGNVKAYAGEQLLYETPLVTADSFQIETEAPIGWRKILWWMKK